MVAVRFFMSKDSSTWKRLCSKLSSSDGEVSVGDGVVGVMKEISVVSWVASSVVKNSVVLDGSGDIGHLEGSSAVALTTLVTACRLVIVKLFL